MAKKSKGTSAPIVPLGALKHRAKQTMEARGHVVTGWFEHRFSRPLVSAICAVCTAGVTVNQHPTPERPEVFGPGILADCAVHGAEREARLSSVRAFRDVRVEAPEE